MKDFQLYFWIAGTFVFSCMSLWYRKKLEWHKGELKKHIRLPVLIYPGKGDTYSTWVYVDRNGKVFAPENENERVLELVLFNQKEDADHYRQQLGGAHWTPVGHPHRVQFAMLGRVFSTAIRD